MGAFSGILLSRGLQMDKPQVLQFFQQIESTMVHYFYGYGHKINIALDETESKEAL